MVVEFSNLAGGRQMDIRYSDNVKQWPEGYSLVQNATKQLEEVVGRSSNVVSGEWDRSHDEKGREFVTLRLKDLTGEAERQFDLDDLRSVAMTSSKLRLIWDNLLSIRAHKQLDAWRRGRESDASQN